MMSRSGGARTTLIGWGVFLLVLGWSSSSVAASFADLPKEWTEIPLLADRMVARFPKTAQVAPTAHGIMEAPQPYESQLRVILDSGPARMVVTVVELFRLAPADFVGLGRLYVKALEQRFHLTLSIAENSETINGLEVLEYEPRGTRAVSDAHLLKAVLVRQVDGSLQSISFFVNDHGLADLPAAHQVATDVVASLRPGSRMLVSGVRGQVAGTRLTLDLPPGYTAYRQRGPDFDVHWVEHLVTIGQPAGRLGIYAGHHPQRPSAPATSRAERTVLFGVDTEWRAWERTADGSAVILWREAFLPSFASGVTMHVFFYALSDDERAAFQRIAETASFQ
jgi:hypothetical protein